MALVPNLIQLLLSQRGGGGGGGGYSRGGGGYSRSGYSRGGYSRGGYRGGSRGSEPFDPYKAMEKEAGKEALNDAFDFEMDRDDNQFFDQLEQAYLRNNAFDIPMPAMPNPGKEIQKQLGGD